MTIGITVDDLIQDTRDLLRGETIPVPTRLDAAITDSDTTLDVEFNEDSIRPGSLLSIGTETLRVYSITGATATVERGADGTTAAAHADKAIVDIDPRYPAGLILRRLADELRSWPDELHRIATVALDVPADTDAVDLDGVTSIHRIIDARVSPDPDRDVEGWPRVEATLLRDADPTDFPSGFAVLLPVTWDEDRTLRVTYAQPLDLSNVETTTTDLGDVGLTVHLTDIPPFGAGWRLLTSGQVSRTNTRSGREFNNVGENARIRTADYLRTVRDRRLAEERTRILADRPWKGF